MLSTTSGYPIARIKGGRKNEKFLRISDDVPEDEGDDLLSMIRHAMSATDFKVPDGELIVTPSVETERIYIAGKSGCGKSTMAARYMAEYLKMFPDRRIILFSRHTAEPAYEEIPHQAIELNEELLEQPIELKEIENALVVFDDTDNLQDRRIKKALQLLNDDIISNGRKYNIHCLTLAHQLLNYKESRNLLNEANRVIFFNNGTTFHIKNYLTKYAGVDAQMVRKILGLKSRWTLVSLGYPMYILHEHGAFLLNSS